MADLTTLQTTNSLSTTPKENLGRPAGAVGYFDDLESEKKSAVAAAEKIINTSRDIFSATSDLLSEITGIGYGSERATEDTGSKQSLEIGGETEKVFNNPDQVNYRKAQETIRYYAEIDQAVKQVPLDRIQKLAKDLERISGGEFSVIDAKAAAQPNVTKPDLDPSQGSEVSINSAFLIWNGREQKLELTKNPSTSVATNIPGGAKPAIGFEVGENELINNETHGWKNVPG